MPASAALPSRLRSQPSTVLMHSTSRESRCSCETRAKLLAPIAATGSSTVEKQNPRRGARTVPSWPVFSRHISW